MCSLQSGTNFSVQHILQAGYTDLVQRDRQCDMLMEVAIEVSGV